MLHLFLFYFFSGGSDPCSVSMCHWVSCEQTCWLSMSDLSRSVIDEVHYNRRRQKTFFLKGSFTQKLHFCYHLITAYLSIVADHVHPFMNSVYPSSDDYFQQDNAPCHKAQTISDWILEHDNEFTLLKWPHQISIQKSSLGIRMNGRFAS